jgi:uncharacterized protein (TIGR03086 family)
MGIQQEMEQLDRALELFGARVDAAASESAWSAQSPCEGWTAGDVVAHVTRNLRGLGVATEGGDFLSTAQDQCGPDPAAEFREASAAARASLARSDGPTTTADVRIGPTTMSLEYLVVSLMRDVVIHTWDLARATGGDEQLDDGLVDAATAAMALVSPAMRRPDSYGEALSIDVGMDAQVRLLAMSGRRA